MSGLAVEGLIKCLLNIRLLFLCTKTLPQLLICMSPPVFRRVDSLSEDMSLAQAIYDKKLMSMQENLQGLGKYPVSRCTNVCDGRPWSVGVGWGPPPIHGTQSRAAFTNLLDIMEGRPWLPASCPAGEPSAQRELLPWDMPRTGARASVCRTVPARASRQRKKPKTVQSPNALSCLKWLFKTFQTLLTSQSFPHYCL